MALLVIASVLLAHLARRGIDQLAQLPWRQPESNLTNPNTSRPAVSDRRWQPGPFP